MSGYKLNLAPIPFNKLMDKLSNEEMDLVKEISRGGKLKTKCPELNLVDANKIIKYKVPDEDSAKVVYLWKRVAYWLSPYKKDHAALPNPIIYFPANDSIAVGAKTRLDEISELIINNVSAIYHYGPISRGEK